MFSATFRKSLAAAEANLFAQSSLCNADTIQAIGMIPALQRLWRTRHESALPLQAVASGLAGRN